MKIHKILILILIMLPLKFSLAQSNPFDYYVKYLSAVEEARHMKDLRSFIYVDPKNPKYYENMFSNEKTASKLLADIKHHAIYPNFIMDLKQELGKNNSTLYVTGKSQSGFHTIRVRMIKIDYSWKIISEDWNWDKRLKNQSKQNNIDDLPAKIEEFFKKIPSDIKEKIPVDIYKIRKYIPFILGSIIALIVIFIIIFNKKAQAERERMLKKFSLKHGMDYSKEDKLELGKKVVESGVMKTYQMKTAKAQHVLSYSDWGSKLYLFSCTMGQQKSKINYTVCFFELAKNTNVKIHIRKKLFGFLEKMIMSMLGSNLEEVKIETYSDFKKNFIVYSDNPSLALKHITPEVTEHINTNKKKIITSGTLITLAGDKFIVMYQHGGLRGYFSKERDLEQFLNFSKLLKQKFLRAF